MRKKHSGTIREKKKFYEPVKCEDHRVVAFRESRAKLSKEDLKI